MDWELLLSRSIGLAGLPGPVGSVPVALPSSADRVATSGLPSVGPRIFSPTPHLSSERGLVAPHESPATPPSEGTLRRLHHGDPAPGARRASAPDPLAQAPGSAAVAVNLPRDGAFDLALTDSAPSPPMLTEPTDGFEPTRHAGTGTTDQAHGSAGASAAVGSVGGGLNLIRPGDQALRAAQLGDDSPTNASLLTAGHVGSGVALGTTALGVLIHRQRTTATNTLAARKIARPRTGPYAPRSLIRSILGDLD